jgi:transposase
MSNMDSQERLERIEAMLAVLVERQTVREWYTTTQAAQLFGKAEFTVREWCRRGRVNAAKKASGRGGHTSWAISHNEVLRIQREGLLPRRQPGQEDGEAKCG